MLGKYGPSLTLKQAKDTRLPSIGKYAGRRIGDLMNNTRYLRWFLNNVYDYENYTTVSAAISMVLANKTPPRGKTKMRGWKT